MLRTFTPTDLQSLFQAFALLESGASVCLFPPELSPPPFSPIPSPLSPSSRSTLNSQLSTSSCSLPSELTTHNSQLITSPFLGLYSSGSTGAPKLFWHPWAQLKAELRLTSENAGWNWASPFSSASFAGVQVALQAWASTRTVLSIPAAWKDTFEFLAAHDVHALSCTPTFLDLSLQQSTSSQVRWKPLQITLGGEPLRESAGARFRKAFPNTRFTTIYASAEFGVLLKTHRLDGRYEVRSLKRRFHRWQIENGELQLFLNDAWQTTGDLAELNGWLIRVIGRADAVANVAGSKVSLAEIGRLAEEVPGVRAAVAFAETSPVTGQIVALRFLPENGFADADVQLRLETHLRHHLRKEAWPRRWEIGPIELGSNSKRINPVGRSPAVGQLVSTVVPTSS